MKIAYQGIEGSFSHRTLAQMPGVKIGMATFSAVYKAVERGDVDLGLLPIENTLAGTIYETIDLLSQGDLNIVGELYTRIEHSLLALPGAKIKKVLSHPKALAQCVKLFEEHPDWTPVSHYDTAGAAADVARLGDRSLGAIANRAAAAIYGLEIVKEGIQDHKDNYTRFFLISKQESKGKKGSFCFTIDHQPGKLAEILHLFAKEGINLSYIVSRPIVGRPFEYLFYVDLEFRGKWPHIEGKWLGTYETISDWRD
ncbi:MAG: prephenate dehydratase domain-containing protein [Chlamydiales bacterium]